MAMPAEDTMTSEFERLNQLGAEDPSLKDTLINMFLEQSPDLMANIESTAGSEEAIDTKNAAHTFKGVCLNLGFETAGNICKQIEDAALSNDFEQVKLQIAELKNVMEELSTKLKAMVS